MAGTVARQSIRIFHGWVGFGLGLVLSSGFNDDRCPTELAIRPAKQASKPKRSTSHNTTGWCTGQTLLPILGSLSGAWTWGGCRQQDSSGTRQRSVRGPPGEIKQRDDGMDRK